jgi:hypothetical protein
LRAAVPVATLSLPVVLARSAAVPNGRVVDQAGSQPRARAPWLLGRGVLRLRERGAR